MKTTDPRKSQINKVSKGAPFEGASEDSICMDQKPATEIPTPLEGRTDKASHVKALMGLSLLGVSSGILILSRILCPAWTRSTIITRRAE